MGTKRESGQKDWKKNVGRVKLLQPTKTSDKDTRIEESRKSSYSSVDRNEISRSVSEALRMARAKSMWDGGLKEFDSDHELPEDFCEEEAEKESDKGPSVCNKNDQEMMKEIRKINRNDIGCISQSEVEQLKKLGVAVEVLRKDPSSEDLVWIKNYPQAVKRLRDAQPN